MYKFVDSINHWKKTIFLSQVLVSKFWENKLYRINIQSNQKEEQLNIQKK